ncbi:MAG: hypothetical protein SNJ84_06065 [Verrucomicrobiia bacterium]
MSANRFPILRWPWVTFFLLLLILPLPAPGQSPGLESPSPAELLPATIEPGLRQRAIPGLLPSEPPPSSFRPLFRLTRPFYDTLQAPRPPPILPETTPLFRPVRVHNPLQGLRPLPYPNKLWHLQPYVGTSLSYDSNIDLAPTNQKSDHYFTLNLGADFFLGTPDSIYLEELESITALTASYHLASDFFLNQTDFDALNQEARLQGRIGRDRLILRPYVHFTDITASGLLTEERANRTRRIRMNTGTVLHLQPTQLLRWTLHPAYGTFDHTDPAYIDFENLRISTELGYRLLTDVFFFPWFSWEQTDPNRGSNGREIKAGLGWQGKFDPRLYSELRLGWGTLDLDDSVPSRRDLSGIRVEGYTTFDWSPRLRLTLKYDRRYVFNELDPNDNYVSTAGQFKAEILLADAWFLTPYFAITYSDFETSRRELLQLRPETELAFVFLERSRLFFRIGYEYNVALVGPGQPVEAIRYALGLNYAF